MIYYVQGKTPIPMNEIIRWEVVEDEWKISFTKNAFKDQREEHIRSYKYESPEAALEDANNYWEWSNK
jgi:hypothetical protein